MNDISRATRFLAVVLAFTINVAHANEPSVEQWPQFRGPGGNAIAHGQSIPLEFGPEKNVRWSTALPAGHSSPCVWGDRVFITGFAGTTVKMICLDAVSGKVLWERERSIPELPPYVHLAGSPANPTPATDGTRVVFVFDDYGVFVFDVQGELLWEKKLPPTHNEYSHGASPIINQGHIYLNRDGGNASCLLCLDADTGKEVWNRSRREAEWGFCSPYLFNQDGRQLLLIGGTGRLAAYDTETGEPAWYVTGLPFFICPSPVAAGNLIYFGGWTTAHVAGTERVKSLVDDSVGVPPKALTSPDLFIKHFDQDLDNHLSREELPAGRARESFAFSDENGDGLIDLKEWATNYNKFPALPGRNVLLAIKGGGLGDVTESHIQWEITRSLPYVASPLAYRGRVYLVAAGGIITCADAATGSVHFKKRLGEGGEYFATPVAVGEHVIICAQRGTIFVIKADDQFNVIHRTDLQELIFATPAVADNTLFVRTENQLWAFGDSRQTTRTASSDALPLITPELRWTRKRCSPFTLIKMPRRCRPRLFPWGVLQRRRMCR